MNTIFTTRGHLPADQVELVNVIQEDNEDRTVTRVDKYDRTDGAWVGNDLHIDVKRLPPVFADAGSVA